MNKEQIVEYLEKEIDFLQLYFGKDQRDMLTYKHLLTKIKEEPKPVELEVGGYYCDLAYPKHKFRVLSVEGGRYYYIGFNSYGRFIVRDWYALHFLEGLRHLTPDEIKEIDQRSMSGKEVTVTIDGVEYTAVIK